MKEGGTFANPKSVATLISTENINEALEQAKALRKGGDPLVALWFGAEAFAEFTELAKTIATIPDDPAHGYSFRGVEIRRHHAVTGRTVVPVYARLEPKIEILGELCCGEYIGQPFELAVTKGVK